jgi:hypothetical protein
MYLFLFFLRGKQMGGALFETPPNFIFILFYFILFYFCLRSLPLFLKHGLGF